MNSQSVLSIFDNLCDITKSKLVRKRTVATNIHHDSENNRATLEDNSEVLRI